MKRDPAWNITAIRDSFAAAALDSKLWTNAMETMTEQTGSYGCVLMPATGIVPNDIFSKSLTDLNRVYMSDGWFKRDIRARAAPLFRTHGVYTEQHYTTPDEIARHPYFQDLLNPFGLRWSAMIRMQAGNDLWVVALQRSLKDGPYSNEEMVRMDELSAQVSAVGALTNALGFARADAALEAFELSGSAVIFLDRTGKVMSLNRAAEKMVGPDLQIVQRRLMPRDSEAASALGRALQTLLWSSDGSAKASNFVAIPRAGRTPLLAYPVRLASVSVDALAPCQAAIVLHDPEDRPMPSSQALKACFGLTEAEAKLALHLSGGSDLSTAADALEISKITARNQLSAAMRKMGVNRQAELVLMVSRVAPSQHTPR